MSKYVKRWNIPVTDHLDKQLVEYIEKDAFSTKSEFIRTAVRDRLEEERKKLRASQETS
jgi:Arc/MetJ-type ribon-helix-helix transcriptional regulator